MGKVLEVGLDASAAFETRSQGVLQMKVAVEVQAPAVSFRSGEATHFAAGYECAEAGIGFVGMEPMVNRNCMAEEAHSDMGGGRIAHLAADTVVVVRTVGHFESWEACQEKKMPVVAEKMGWAVVDKAPAFGHMFGETTNTLSCWEDPHTAWVVVRKRENPPAVIELAW